MDTEGSSVFSSILHEPYEIAITETMRRWYNWFEIEDVKNQ